MLITARSKALLGSRADATTAAHGGAQDIGLFAAPPVAFGASLSLSSPTYAMARPSDVDGGAAQAILGPQPSIAPFTPVGLASADASLPPDGASHVSPPSPAPVGLSAIAQPALATIATPMVEVVPGSSGSIIPHAGLPDMGAASPSTATAPSPSAVELTSSVAPLIADVGSSPIYLQATVVALLGQLGSADQAAAFAQIISGQSAALSQNVTILTDGIASLSNQLGAASDDSLTAISQAVAQTVYDVGGLAPAVTQALGAAPTIIDTILSDVVASAETALDQTVPFVGTVVAATGGTVDMAVDQIDDIVAPITNAVTNIVGDVAGSVSATNELIDRTVEPVTQLVQQAALPTIAAVAEPVTQQASTIVTASTDVVADAAGTLTDTVSDIAAPIVDIAQDAPANLIAPAIAQPVDMLGDLAGADPVGGVTTLTSLVSAADILETHDEAPQTSGLFLLQGATDTLDGLIAGDPGDGDGGGGLLGIVPQHHGLLDGLTDHDGHGGLGLGLG